MLSQGATQLHVSDLGLAGQSRPTASTFPGSGFVCLLHDTMHEAEICVTSHR